MDVDITNELNFKMIQLGIAVFIGFILAYWLFTRVIKQWQYIKEVRPYYVQSALRDVKNHSVYIIKVEGESDHHRVYVGVTNNFERRFGEHKVQLESGSHANHKMQNVFNEGGRFVMHRIGRDYTKMEAYSKEHQLRPKWNTGLNIAPGGLRGIHY
ncbi:GIY-YIG nuclease family protein [Vibrio alfacsensis]|uniref:GIY-YIG nuclease family protein n=1 Tax=Vibrio alfacsensis TaxID=1074311 RepID=UPI001BEE5BDB|nr:GIY-YIG nuclease family protein [Vibrio alfacsensis]BCN25759.1 hypothetical protein VYA_29510 [Vibrio alfacsensis]